MWAVKGYYVKSGVYARGDEADSTSRWISEWFCLRSCGMMAI